MIVFVPANHPFLRRRRIMTRSALMLVALLSSPVVSVPAQESGTPQFRAVLKISGDLSLAASIEEYLKQALSSIKDVEISETKPDYTINIIVMQIENREKTPIGIALTWLSLYHPKGFFEDCSLIEDYRLLTLEQENMQGECQKLVARFEAKSLQPHRKIFQKSKP